MIILTARDELHQRVEGLNCGAYDYLCKPFALSELVARLNALIRSSHAQVSPIIHHRHITFDPVSQQVTSHEEPVSLTVRDDEQKSRDVAGTAGREDLQLGQRCGQ